MIGTLGNIFAEYVLAGKVHTGATALSGTQIVLPTGPAPTSGFQMIRVTSMAAESGSVPGAAVKGVDGVPSSNDAGNDDVTQLSKMILKILGRFNHATDAAPS